MSEHQINGSSNLANLQHQNKQAFASLVDQNAERIYRLVYKMLGNEQDAEDVLQETFLKAYRHIEGFEGRSSISTWLYRIAVNESLMLLRKQKDNLIHLEEEGNTDNDDLYPRQIIDWCCLPEKELMSQEARLYIRQAVNKLSAANRAAFLLRDVEGLSTRQAAKALDISESALKIRLMRARLQLREELTVFFADRMAEEKA